MKTEFETAIDFIKEINKIDPTATTIIVGGAVRDVVMGKNSNDVDIATSIPVEVIDQHFESYDIGKNKDFGITVVNYGGYS
jgi:tRNA nucleotidyltransferase/poly(A) polymerase